MLLPSLQHVIESSRLDTLPDILLQFLQEHLGSEHAELYTVSHTSQELILRGRVPVLVPDDPDIDELKISQNTGIAGRWLTKGIIPRISDGSILLPQEFAVNRANIKAILSIPISLREQPVALTTFAWFKNPNIDEDTMRSVFEELNSPTVATILEYLHHYRHLQYEKNVIRRQNTFLSGVRQPQRLALQSIYDSITSSLLDSFDLACCSLNVFNRFDNTVTVRSFSPFERSSLLSVLKYDVDNSISGRAIKANDTVLTEDVHNETMFHNQQLARVLGLSHAYSIPLHTQHSSKPDPTNDRIVAVLNLYPKRSSIYFDSHLLTFIKQIAESEIQRAKSVEQLMILHKIEEQFQKSSDVDRFGENLVQLLLEFLQVEGVSLFALDQYRSCYYLIGTSGLTTEEKPFNVTYRPKEGLTGHLLSLSHEPSIISQDVKKDPRHIGKWKEKTKHEGKSFLGTVLRDHLNKIIGCIRTTNKTQRLKPHLVDTFSQDDKDFIEYAAHWISTFLEILRGEEDKKRLLVQTTHEAKSPLIGIKTKTSKLIKSLESQTTTNTQRRKWLNDIYAHYSHLQMEISNTELANEEMVLKKVPTYLYGDVIIPVIKDLEVYCKERELNPRNITYGPYLDIPQLLIDRKRFFQVFHNLLKNAIKYAFDDRQAFSINVNASYDEKEVRINVEDYGIGVPDEYSDDVFTMRFRAPGIEQKDVSGRGLGLYIVKRIVEGHEGRIFLSRNTLPTTFTITLPSSIIYQRRPTQ